MKKVILSIDQSYTSSGYCVFVNGEMTTSGLIKSDKTLDIFERAWNSAQIMLDLANDHKADVVVLEGLAFGMRGSATRDLAGLQFTIVTMLRFIGNFEVQIIAPLTVKKFATGSGRAKKEHLLEVLPLNLKKYFVEDLGLKKSTGLTDVVDAYWIGMTAANTL